MSTTDTITCHHGLGPVHPWEPYRHCPPEPVEPAPDTERDERLREAREAATRARAQNPPLGIEKWLITLDEEVTRLDAVVTAVREVREEYFDEDGHTEPEDVWRLHRDLGRALDGGAS